MKKSFKKNLGLFLLGSLLLAGCQSAPNIQPAAVTQQIHNIPNVPYSHGPISPPSVKGPSAPFPSPIGDSNQNSSSQVENAAGQTPLQAMTETEEQRFTLN